MGSVRGSGVVSSTHVTASLLMFIERGLDAEVDGYIRGNYASEKQTMTSAHRRAP